MPFQRFNLRAVRGVVGGATRTVAGGFDGISLTHSQRSTGFEMYSASGPEAA